MRYLLCLVIFLLLVPISVVYGDEVCAVEVLSCYGYEPEGVVHEGEYATIYLIYPGKTGKDIDRVKVKVGDELISIGMLDMLFNNFDNPVSISGFKVGTGDQEILFSYTVLLPPDKPGEKPVIAGSGKRMLKVVKPKRF